MNKKKTRKNFSPLIKIKVPQTKKPKTPKRVSPPELRDMDKTAGFTLIEILVVLALIAILAAIVIVAINPARQFKQGRDSQRFSNLNTILDGIDQRIADNQGMFAGAVSGGAQTCPNLTTGGADALATGTPYEIISSANPNTGQIDLSCLVPTYIPNQLPADPSMASNGTSDPDTGYKLAVDGNGRITLSAPYAELATNPISVTR